MGVLASPWTRPPVGYCIGIQITSLNSGGSDKRIGGLRSRLCRFRMTGDPGSRDWGVGGAR